MRHTPAEGFARFVRPNEPDDIGPAASDPGLRSLAEADPDAEAAVDPGFPEPVPEETPAVFGRPRSGGGRFGEHLGRLGLEQPGARALAVVGLVAVLLAGGYLWASRPKPQPLAAEVPKPSAAVSPTVPAASASPSLVVHVAGKVRKPGVVTLPAGARVTDAIRAAGGLRPGARTGSLNLARRVVDGEQLMVGVAAPSATPAPPGTGPPGPGSSAAPGEPLDLNTATVEQFDTLPGVGPVLAQRIVDYRTQHGGFRSVEQLQDVSGIGARRYAELKSLVKV